MHEVLVNRLGGLSLPRKSVVRLTDRPDMTLDVYRGRTTTIQPTNQRPNDILLMLMRHNIITWHQRQYDIILMLCLLGSSLKIMLQGIKVLSDKMEEQEIKPTIPRFVVTTTILLTSILKSKQIYEKTVELQWLKHRWLVYHGCFELVLESLGKNCIAADLG